VPASRAANAVVMAAAGAALVGAVVGAAVRWRARTVALAFRAGHAAGVAWAALCSFGAWLLDSIRRLFR